MPTSSTHAPTAGQPIPAPADFPITWENPADAKLYWMQETHSKFPMAPLAYAVEAAFLRGANPAHDEIGLPFHVRAASL